MSTEILRPKLPPLLRARRFRKVNRKHLPTITIGGSIITVDGKPIIIL
jgi:hypothetical protein